MRKIEEKAFSSLARLACHVARMPMAIIALADDGRQFKASVGGGPPPLTPCTWPPLRWVTAHRATLICEDLSADARFENDAGHAALDSAAAGSSPCRGMIALPLPGPRGTSLGVLAVMDVVPHTADPRNLEALELLAQTITLQLDAMDVVRIERRLGHDGMEEAQRLAAELHDGVGQDLVGISMIVSALKQQAARGGDDMVAALKNVAQLLTNAIGNCRMVAEGYGGFMVRKEGITGALRRYVESLGVAHVRIEFLGDIIPLACLDETEAYYLFGIAREAIANACRHAACSVVRVTCEHRAGVMRLVVEDNGCGDTARIDSGGASSDAAEDDGGELAPAGGIGRAIMDYRARRIGATLAFTAAEPQGLRVTCDLPCGTQRWGHATSCPAQAAMRVEPQPRE